jgi:hypothetical protein
VAEQILSTIGEGYVGFCGKYGDRFEPLNSLLVERYTHYMCVIRAGFRMQLLAPRAELHRALAR